MPDISWERYRLVAESPHARSWLTIQAHLGLAANTIDAYGRALEDYLAFCIHQAVVPESARRDYLAAYVRDLTTRPHLHATNVRVLDSGAGLANATLQQRLTAVRLYYDYLMEEGVRQDNPVGRGRYTPGKGFGGRGDRGLIPRYHKLPWIPDEEQWHAVLEVAKEESYRNRVMFALAYDAGLRREELCALATGDLDPAHRLLHLRAETTKNRRGRTYPIRKPPVSCMSPTCSIGGPSVGSVAHSSSPSRPATERSPFRSGPGRRWSSALPRAPVSRSSARIRCGICA